MATDPNEERAPRLRAMVDEGLVSGPARPDTQADEDQQLALARGTPTLVDLLSLPEMADIEFEPPKASPESPPADFSDVLAAMPNVGFDEDFAHSAKRAWQDYRRTGQSRPSSEVFDRVQERIDARRQWLSENNEALESSNRYVEEHGLPLGGKPLKPSPDDEA